MPRHAHDSRPIVLLTVRIPPALHARLGKLAVARKVSLNALVNTALIRFVALLGSKWSAGGRS